MYTYGASQMALVVKSPPDNEGVCGMDWEIGVEKQTIMYKIDNQ